MATSPNLQSQPCAECNCRSVMFNMLSSEELDFIYQNKLMVTYKKGETIRKQGTAMTHVISVNHGLAKVYLEGPDRRHTIIRIVKPTNFIGGPGIYLDQLHHFSVSALLDTTVCFIEMNAFKRVLDQNRNFAREFIKDFSQNILLVYQRLLNFTHKEIPGRMADTLLYLMEEIYMSKQFELHLSRQDLADISGMSKDSCLKIIQQFQKEGIIAIVKDEMNILDPGKLRQIGRVG
jgi:CRP-like cAMP-binding protein